MKIQSQILLDCFASGSIPWINDSSKKKSFFSCFILSFFEKKNNWINYRLSTSNNCMFHRKTIISEQLKIPPSFNFFKISFSNNKYFWKYFLVFYKKRKKNQLFHWNEWNFYYLSLLFYRHGPHIHNTISINILRTT